MSISLIPHAGKKYAGDLRKKVFKKRKARADPMFIENTNKLISKQMKIIKKY